MSFDLDRDRRAQATGDGVGSARLADRPAWPGVGGIELMKRVVEFTDCDLTEIDDVHR